MAAAKKKVAVRQVFAADLENEFRMMKFAMGKYRIISMDTEFPGTIFKQDKQNIQRGLADSSVNYEFMKANVDALNIIQIGLTLSDAQGNLPNFGTDNCYIWEFNFRDFDIYRHPHDNSSIELLKRQGIDLEKNREKGIDSIDFAAKLKDALSVFNDNWLTWMTFHGAYDFGFLVKILTGRELPSDLNSFMAILVDFFGYNVFDIKHACRNLGVHGGLEKVAQLLNVARVAGQSHQAGSDSLLTLQCGMELKKQGVYESLENLGGLEKVAQLLNVACGVAGERHQAGSNSLLSLLCGMELKKQGDFESLESTMLMPPLALYGLVSNLDHLPMIYEEALYHRAGLVHFPMIYQEVPYHGAEEDFEVPYHGAEEEDEVPYHGAEEEDDQEIEEGDSCQGGVFHIPPYPFWNYAYPCNGILVSASVPAYSPTNQPEWEECFHIHQCWKNDVLLSAPGGVMF